jgi:micrococcal nuclease
MRKNAFGFIVKRFVLILMLIFPSALLPETFAVKCMCIGISDGDTILVMNDGKETKLKIDGIECPELGQDFGKKAKQFTSDLVLGKILEVNIKGLDKSGTIVALVFVENDDIGFELLKAGLAWHFKQYSSDPIYASAEQEAKFDKIGIWSMPNPISPGDFRDNAFNLINTKPSNLSAKVLPSTGQNLDTKQQMAEATPTDIQKVENNEKVNQSSFFDEITNKRKKGLEQFEGKVQEFAKKADEMDIQYIRYMDACFSKYTEGNVWGNTSIYTRGRTWFGGFSGSFSIDNESTVECRKLWSDFSRLVREIKVGMESAMDNARKAAVYPGQLRKVREQYNLDWSGWD